MHVGQRVSLDQHRGTVRYLGPLAGSPSSWIGIEWDDSSRGKHSGTFKEQQIFSCRPGAGSFLKASKVSFDRSYSIADAINHKYIEDSQGIEEEVSNVVGISRPVQSVGFDKIRERFRNLSQISELYLADQNIDHLNISSDTQLSQVTTLDLSWNLLSSFDEVLELSQRLPLQTLKLEGNRFCPLTGGKLAPQSSSVEDLSLSLTYLNWLEIQHAIQNHFTHLSILHLAFNDLSDCSDHFEFKSITSLDLLGNMITDLHLLVSHFPAIETLKISNNRIRSIESSTFSVSERPGARLKHIDLAGNPLDNLHDVSNLACYSGLRSLQFTLLLDDKKDEISRLQIIKSLPQLEVINRTKVTLQERQDAERLGQTPVILTQSMAKNFVTLILVSDTGTLEKKVLKTQSVKQLKTTFARFAKLRPTQIHTLIYEYGRQTIELLDDLAQLSYYDLCDGGSIFHSQ